MILFHKLTGSMPVYWYQNLYFFPGEWQQEPFTLEDSWKQNGSYVFLPPNTIPGLEIVSRMIDFLKGHTKLTFLWVENPNESLSDWKTRALTAADSENGIRRFAPDTEMAFDRYRLCLPEATICCDEESFSIQGSKNYFLASSKNCPISKNIILKAGGAGCGMIQFDMTAEGSGGEEVFTSMDAGIRFYMVQNSKGEQSPVLHTLKCNPLQSGEQVMFHANLHPCRLFDPDLTRFLLPNQVFSSWIVTTGGQRVSLTPGWKAGLVFEKGIKPSETYEAASGSEQWYLGPCGPFTVDGGGGQILCGLSGTEYTDLSAAGDKTLLFVPHQKGLVKEECMTEKASTAWIRFPDGFYYSSQTAEAPLFEVDEKEVSFLKQMEIAVASYRGRSPEIPVAQYAGSRHTFSEGSEVLSMEQVLYGCRRNILTSRLPFVVKPDFGPFTVGAAPQGLTAGIYREWGLWAWLKLGKTRDYKNKERDILLPCPATEISDRLQRERVCFIYQDALSFSNDFFKGEDSQQELTVYADHWSFVFHPAAWRKDFEETNTAVIIKYTEEKSIYELMKDSAILKESLRKAYEKDGKTVRDGYQEFLRLVHEPRFQGTLVLNCPLQYEGLPDFLQVIVGDVDPKLLYAHHVCIAASRIGIKNAQPEQEYTSVSVLVDFEEGEPIVPEKEPEMCDFTTLKLKLLVRESKVESFESVSELLVNAFFGSACAQSDSVSGNCLVLKGTCRDSGNGVEYDFSLESAAEFQVDNNAVESVVVNSVGLSVGGQGEQVFTLGGRMYFSLDEKCDLFGYGQMKDIEAEGETGVRFIGMRYRIDKEENAAADYRDLTVDAQGIEPRPQSFCARFVCSLDGFQTGKGQSPDEQGFLAIKSPLPQAALGEEWYGLDWKIDLGSPGGLSNGEPVYMHLLTAWSGSKMGGDYPCYFGAKLPGAMGGELLDVQGVLKLGFQSVELRMPNPEGEVKEFELRLHNFNLRILGIPLIPWNNDIVLFFHEEGGQKKLGWFAAYENEGKAKSEGEV